MNGDAGGPDQPGTAPAPEATRVGGRFEALRQRSSAVQDQVARRREELERRRHVGLLLLVQRRYVAIPFGAIGASIALLLVVQLLAAGWVVVAAFGAVYWERIADQDTVIQAELDR